MITSIQTKHLSNATFRWALIVSLILIIAALALLSSALPSTAGSSDAEALVMPSSTPIASGLVEFASSFTVGDIGQFAQSSAAAAQAVGPNDTVVILDEGFEGAWLPSGWVAQPRWGASNCRAFAGAKSAWVEGSAGLACGSNYYNDENAFLIYGPFSLADATAATLSHQLWLNSYIGDYLCSMASVNGSDFYGTCWYGSSGNWVQKSRDLTDVPLLGSLAGRSSVWIALVWNTSSGSVKGEGAFVDAVQIAKTVGGSTVTPSPTSGTPTQTPRPTSTPLPTPGWRWRTEMVYGNASGATTSLALDRTGRPYISFYQDFESVLNLARWDGSSWRVELAAPAYWEGEYSSLKLDGVDHPHLAYYSGWGRDRDLIYRHWDGSAWQDEEIVDSDGDAGTYPSLTLDHAGSPHISYYKSVDWQTGELKYAYWDTSAWRVGTVDRGGSSVGKHTSLALDAEGHPHISYLHGDYSWSATLRYARWDGTTWYIETVDNDSRDADTSLALDTAGYPHISYYSSEGLKYAHWDGSNWHIETVDSVDGTYTSLALDNAGHPHIAYGGVKYAHWDGSAWQIEIVEAGRVCKGLSLALDAAGRSRISYFHDDDKTLFFAQLLDAPPMPTPTPTGTPRSFRGSEPELAPVIGGGVSAVWNDSRPRVDCCDVNVMARRFGPDGKPLWPADVRVSIESGLVHTYPALVTRANGNSVVVWQRRGNIYAQELDQSGNRLRSADALIYGWPNNAERPKVGVDQSGNWYVLWRTSWDSCIGAPCPTIQLAKFGPSAWDEVNIIRRLGYDLDLAVAPDSSRLAWREGRIEEDSNIYGLSLSDDGHWRWPNPIRINTDTGSAPQASPHVAIDAAGDTYFVWADKRNGEWDIYAGKFDVNAGHRLWAADVRVNSDATTSDQVEPDLIVSADSYMYVVWADGRNGRADIYAQKLTLDGVKVWPQDLRINAASDAATRSKPVIALDALGFLYIAWESWSDIYMQSYTITGSRCWSADMAVEGVYEAPSVICAPPPTPTPTPTATPSVPWLNWREPNRPLLVAERGANVDVLYGNIPVPAVLSATLAGPATFADGSQTLTASITGADGSYTLNPRPAAGASRGATFTLQVAVAGLQLERGGTIAQAWYLPLLHSSAPAGWNR